MSTPMLTDRYGLSLSTSSVAARDAYVEGCEAKLTMHPGAIEAFDRAIAEDPGFALAHAARAHALLERGDAAAARASIAVARVFLRSWLMTYPRNGALYSHLSWHLALGELEAGDAAASVQLFREAFAPDVHSGPPRGKVNDTVSFLWRCELAGHSRNEEQWHLIHHVANSAFPRAGVAFSDMHAALAHVAVGDDWGLEERMQQINSLACRGRYPSGPLVPAVARGFAAFERCDFSATIDTLNPIAGELERIGGSRAQLDLVEFTLLKAYVDLGRPDEARRMLDRRRRGSLSPPVAGLTAAG